MYQAQIKHDIKSAIETDRLRKIIAECGEATEYALSIQTGISVVELNKILSGAPEYFYSQMENGRLLWSLSH